MASTGILLRTCVHHLLLRRECCLWLSHGLILAKVTRTANVGSGLTCKESGRVTRGALMQGPAYVTTSFILAMLRAHRGPWHFCPSSHHGPHCLRHRTALPPSSPLSRFRIRQIMLCCANLVSDGRWFRQLVCTPDTRRRIGHLSGYEMNSKRGRGEEKKETEKKNKERPPSASLKSKDPPGYYIDK